MSQNYGYDDQTKYPPQPVQSHPPQGYPAQYPAQPYPPVRPTNGFAIAALITSLMGMAIVPVILGHIALRQIKRNGEAGSVMAIIGLVLGYGALAAYILLFILLGAGIWASVAAQ